MSNKKKGLTAWLFRLVVIIFCAALLLSYISVYIPPKDFWVLPLFGLLYPIFLVAVLLSLVYFIFRKSKWFLLCLFTLLLGGKLHFRFVNIGWGNSSAIKTINTKLNIMSYNVRLFDFYNSTEANPKVNKNKILSLIDKEKPDVICFQEFFYTDDKELFNTKDTLFEITGHDYYHERVRFQKKYKRNFGVALYSKYPVIAKGEVSFPKGATNFCIYADIRVNTDTLRIYNTHLQSIRIKDEDVNFNLEDDEETNISRLKTTVKKLKVAYPARTEQVQRILKHAKASPYPVVICGDFNDPPISHTYNLFNKTYIDAFKRSSYYLGRTYAGKIPAGRIDYIWHDEKLVSNNFTIQDFKYSDHYAISADIILP